MNEKESLIIIIMESVLNIRNIAFWWESLIQSLFFPVFIPNLSSLGADKNTYIDLKPSHLDSYSLLMFAFSYAIITWWIPGRKSSGN